LRTRADMSGLLGEPGELDRAAPGRYAHGKRVSAYLELDHAVEHTSEHGPGLVSFSVDPSKVLAVPASLRGGDPEAYWAAAKPLSTWQSVGDLPADLEVHTPVAVRAKYLAIRAPRVDDAHLGPYAPLVAEVADEDRLSAKALMHLALIASEGDFSSPAFAAACALAWRDEEDPDDLVRELIETDPDKVASAALAMYGADAAEAVDALRGALEETREWGDANGVEHGRAIFTRTALVLDQIPSHA
jgi:hypothetical protein